MEPLEGIAEADRHLGRPVPLPRAALPLGRWIEVYEDGPQAVEVVWNLDDTRPATPGRLALRVSAGPAPTQLPDAPARTVTIGAGTAQQRSAPLAEAQPSLRPVTELSWTTGDLALRLTAQGPWDLAVLRDVAASIGADDRPGGHGGVG